MLMYHKRQLGLKPVRIVATVVVAVICSPSLVDAQTSHRLLRSGDLMYDQGEFLRAEEHYRKANEAEESAQAQYNLGSAIYNQERYDEAVRHFESAAEQATDPAVKAGAYYNLGNTHFKAQALDKSVEAYKQALKIDPNDIDTKKNLTLALQRLKQQQQQQQQQSQGDQEQPQPPSPQEEQEQQQQQPQSRQPEDKQEQPTPAEQNLSREEAEELLRIIEAEDSKVQEKLRKVNANPGKPVKDW